MLAQQLIDGRKRAGYASHQRQRETDSHHARVHVQGLHPCHPSKDLRRNCSPGDVKIPIREQHPHASAQNSDHHAFRQQFARDTKPAGAQGRTQANLPLPGGGARKLQVGHVGARQQQNECGRAQQDHCEPVRHIVDGFGQRVDHHAVPRVGFWIAAFQLRAQ